MNFAEKVIDFNKTLQYTGELPEDYFVMNPFESNPETLIVMRQFYEKFYSDYNQRRFIIGINPSRHGAGVTGVPFTDTKRLDNVCGIKMTSARTHEVSSVYMYDMIEAYGGPKPFYANFYINSPFPLAIVKRSKGDQFLNANYYDDPTLFNSLRDYMIESLRKHIALGCDTNEVYILGKKNGLFIEKLNKQANLFKQMTILEHPRFIQQYRSKDKDFYITKYLSAFSSANDKEVVF